MKLKNILCTLLLVLPHQAAASNRCGSGTRYDCGHDSGGNPLKGTQPFWTQSCEKNECCCPIIDGWSDQPPRMGSNTFHVNVCDHRIANDNPIPSGTSVGCWACGGNDEACFNLENSQIGDEACQGNDTCKNSRDMIIWNNACHGNMACKDSSHMVIGEYSCNKKESCYKSQWTKIGSQSCKDEKACHNINIDGAESDQVIIGTNSCNYDTDMNSEGVCQWCAAGSVVPNNACSGGTSGTSEDDLSSVENKDGGTSQNGLKCNFCLVSCFIFVS